MIRDVLIPELQKRFPERGLQIDTTSNRIAAFPAALAEVGKVIIYDDGEEATVMIEHITHGHFNPYNPALSQDEVDRQVSEDVIDFLEALFEDKILLWVSPKWVDTIKFTLSVQHICEPGSVRQNARLTASILRGHREDVVHRTLRRRIQVGRWFVG